jgi:hypothetical protein
MKVSRTLLTAGVFALLAMIYVPTPAKPYHAAHYRFVFSQDDTSVAFFQLLVNVVFAALLGAILAAIIPKLPRWAWRWITGIALIAFLIMGALAWRNFTAAAADRARFDEEFADSQLAYHYPDAAKFTLRNAARNWRLALRFDEATRVENRIKELQQHPAQDWHNDPVVDLSGLPHQAPAQAPVASGQRAPTPFPSRSAEHGPWEDFAAQGQPAPTPEKHISTHPKAGEPNVFDQFDSSAAVPIPRARPVRSPSPR